MTLESEGHQEGYLSHFARWVVFQDFNWSNFLSSLTAYISMYVLAMVLKIDIASVHIILLVAWSTFRDIVINLRSSFLIGFSFYGYNH